MGPLIVTAVVFKPQVQRAEIAKSWPQVRYEGDARRDEDTAHRDRDVRLTQGEYSPDYSATPRVILHPPSSPPNGCPVSRSMSWSRRRPWMIKCENESGKLDEVR